MASRDLSKDELIAGLLASGLTQEQVAGQLHLGVRTVRRRVADPAFQALVAAARSRMLAEAVELAKAGTLASIRRLLLIVDDAGAERRDQSLAAYRAIASMVRLGTYADLDARLRALEADRGAS